MSSNTIILPFALVFIIFSQAKPQLTFNVVELGAIADGKTDSSKSFLDAWKAACGSLVPASIYVPPGRFLIRGLYFGDKCKTKNVLFRIDGVLVAPADFLVTGNMANWIHFRQVDGVTISGGILDAQGIGLWDCKLAGKACPSGATVCNYVCDYTKISTGSIFPSKEVENIFLQFLIFSTLTNDATNKQYLLKQNKQCQLLFGLWSIGYSSHT